MLIKQIIEFELREHRPLCGTCTPKLVIFMTKQKSLKGDFREEFYLQLKYCRRHCILLSPTWAKSLTKFNTKMQDFQLICFGLKLQLKGGLNNLIFLIDFQMLKI